MAITTIHYLLFMAFKASHGFKKTQFGFVFAAYVLAYTGGTAVFLPVYHLSLPWFALYLIPIGHVIVAYAILRHQLMDIAIIIRKTLLYSILTAAMASLYAGIVTLLARVMEN